MVTTYTVNIINETTKPKNYFLFSKPPVISDHVQAAELYTNAWIVFDSTPDQGNQTVTYTDTFYGYWGRAPKLSPGVVVTSGQSLPVTLGPGGTILDFTAGDAATFTTLTRTTDSKGAYAIQSHGDFEVDTSPYVFGLSKVNKAGVKVPVATFKAQPNETYIIAPVTKFYVAEASRVFQTGEVIDVNSYSTTAEIDFTGRSEKTVTITQNKRNAYDVSYS